jgi:hypothetical protein
VLSLPSALRYRLAFDSSLVRDVLQITVRAVFASIRGCGPFMDDGNALWGLLGSHPGYPCPPTYSRTLLDAQKSMQRQPPTQQRRPDQRITTAPSEGRNGSFKSDWTLAESRDWLGIFVFLWLSCLSTNFPRFTR